jgi:fatty-acyl-CoA synthase
MAEYTLAIAFSTGVPTDRVLSASLWERGVAEPAPDDADPADVVEIVHCGEAFSEHGIRIVDVESRAVLDDRRVGEIEICGPSVMQGYYEMPEATSETIGEDGWMRTGDLGYLADGNIYICGRAKDVIIVNGKNYYPQDIERIASEVHGIRQDQCVAFARAGADGSEECVLVAEATKLSDDPGSISSAIKNRVRSELGVSVAEVVLIKRNTMPKTSSGKVRRRETKSRLECSRLELVAPAPMRRREIPPARPSAPAM